MKTFLIKFNGRKKGALGAFSNFIETVTAPNKQSAILKLYEKYEHIYETSTEILPYIEVSKNVE